MGFLRVPNDILAPTHVRVAVSVIDTAPCEEQFWGYCRSTPQNNNASPSGVSNLAPLGQLMVHGWLPYGHPCCEGSAVLAAVPCLICHSLHQDPCPNINMNPGGVTPLVGKKPKGIWVGFIPGGGHCCVTPGKESKSKLDAKWARTFFFFAGVAWCGQKTNQPPSLVWWKCGGFFQRHPVSRGDCVGDKGCLAGGAASAVLPVVDTISLPRRWMRDAQSATFFVVFVSCLLFSLHLLQLFGNTRNEWRKGTETPTTLKSFVQWGVQLWVI